MQRHDKRHVDGSQWGGEGATSGERCCSANLLPSKMPKASSSVKWKSPVVTASPTTVRNVPAAQQSYSTAVDDASLEGCTDGDDDDRWGGVRRQRVVHQSRDEDGDERYGEHDRLNVYRCATLKGSSE